MASITDMAARFSGIVTYNDNTVGYFHCQYEGGNNWGVFTSGGTYAQIEITNTTVYDAIQTALWENLSFVSAATMDAGAAATKTITDIVLMADFLFSLDDSTSYPAYSRYDFGGQHRLDLPDLITESDNLSTYTDKLDTMLALIFDTAAITPSS